MYNVDITVVQFTLSYVWLLFLTVSIKMHSSLYFMVECCCMYLIVVVHSKSNCIYVFIEYGQPNEFVFHVVC
jgi:hypothetical protein